MNLFHIVDSNSDEYYYVDVLEYAKKEFARERRLDHIIKNSNDSDVTVYLNAHKVAKSNVEKCLEVPVCRKKLE